MRQEIEPKRKSFEAACRVVDIIMDAKWMRISMHDASRSLRVATSDAMRLHIQAYGTDHVKPKHHWIMDLPDQFLKDPVVLDAFVVERLHVRVKRCAEHISNHTGFERSVLASVLTSTLGAECNAGICGLEGEVGTLAEFPGAVVSRRMTICGHEIAAGDMVFQGDVVARCMAAAFEEDGLHIIAQRFERVRQVSANSVRCKSTDAVVVFEASSVCLARAWYSDSGEVVVLR